jgi:transposase-like protein
MPSKVDRIKVVFDKRKKLNPDDKATIRQLYNQGWAIRAIGRYYGVSHRTIQFILFPERLEHNKELRRKRLENDPQRYYDRERHTEAVRDLRIRKKIENIEQFTRVCPICGRTFLIHNNLQKYCNKKCMWKSGNRKARQKRADNNK